MNNTLPCPFCGNIPDLSDIDTVYPTGYGWIIDEQTGIKIY